MSEKLAVVSVLAVTAIRPSMFRSHVIPVGGVSIPKDQVVRVSGPYPREFREMSLQHHKLQALKQHLLAQKEETIKMADKADIISRVEKVMTDLKTNNDAKGTWLSGHRCPKTFAKMKRADGQSSGLDLCGENDFVIVGMDNSGENLEIYLGVGRPEPGKGNVDRETKVEIVTRSGYFDVRATKDGIVVMEAKEDGSSDLMELPEPTASQAAVGAFNPIKGADQLAAKGNAVS